MGRVCLLETEKDLLGNRNIGAEREIIGEFRVSGRSEEVSLAGVGTCVQTSSRR